MTLRSGIVYLVFACFLGVVAFAGTAIGDEADQLYAKGEQFLNQGDFDSALKAFGAAAKAAPENRSYLEQAMLVHRVGALRKFVSNNQDSPGWENAVLSLHGFYMTRDLLRPSLDLTQSFHEKMNNSLSASMLSATLLAMNKNADALAMLENLEGEKLDQQNKVYMGIALARLDRLEDAKKVRASCLTTDETGTGLLCDTARLDTLLGDQQSALRLLIACFEQTPPSQLARTKTYVNDCPDFESLVKTQRFDRVMQTLSKINESSCSSGATCGSCPSKSQCGSKTSTKTSECGSCDSAKSSDCSSCDKK